MTRKNKLSRTIELKEPVSDAPAIVESRIEREVGKLSNHDLIEKITKSPVCFKNYKYPGADTSFKGIPLMLTCEQYYPLAEGGPLYVDEPQFDQDYKDCEKKREVMKKNGTRYLVMGKKADGSYVDTIDAMEQLGIK